MRIGSAPNPRLSSDSSKWRLRRARAFLFRLAYGTVSRTDYPHSGDYRDARVTEIDGKRVIVVGKGAGQRVVDLHEELGPVEGFGNQKVVLALGDGALGIYNRPMASRALGDVERQLQSELANARFVSRFNLGESPPPQAGPDINGLRTIFFPERFKIGSRQIVIEDDGTVLRPDVLNQGMIDYLTGVREAFVAHGLAMDGLEFLFRENGTGIPADFHETYEMGSDSVLLKTRYPLDEEPVPVDTPEDRAKYEHVHADNLRNIDGLLEAHVPKPPRPKTQNRSHRPRHPAENRPARPSGRYSTPSADG